MSLLLIYAMLVFFSVAKGTYIFRIFAPKIRNSMSLTKRFIAPGGWFAMDYPAAWSEFEDGEGSFLFYNPDVWDGNFRISAFKGGASYAEDNLNDELRTHPDARVTMVGEWKCAYSMEEFEEEGEAYDQHLWVTGSGEVAVECSFTVHRGGSAAQAQAVVASLQLREAGKKYPAEMIPVRLWEIWQIDEAYAQMEHEVKERYKEDFQGSEEDVPRLQRLVEEAGWSKKKRDPWIALGIVLCVILSNELDGYEWCTLIDGNREAPVLLHTADGKVIDPMKLVWSRVKAGEAINLVESVQSLFSD